MPSGSGASIIPNAPGKPKSHRRGNQNQEQKGWEAGLANKAIGSIAPAFGMLMDKFGGPPSIPMPRLNAGGYAERHAQQAAADRQSANRAGLVITPGQPKQPSRMGSMYGGSWSMGPGGFFNNPLTTQVSGSYGGREYDSPITNRYRVRGDDSGPMQLLKDSQGSNRGSGNWQPAIPRYSIAETRQNWHKYDPRNFMALNKHPGQKYLSPGTEVMMRRQERYTGGARATVRKFL